MRRAGLALGVIGLLDMAACLVSVALGQSYSSSLNIFALIAGVLVYRGSTGAARFVVQGLSFLLGGIILLPFVMLVLMPIRLLRLELKLAPMETLSWATVSAGLFALLLWIRASLGSLPLYPGGQRARPLHRSPAAAAGAGIPLLLAVFLPFFMQGESGHRAIAEAQREVGPGYSFYVGQLSTSGKSGAAVVTAYSDTEIRKVVVEWSDEKEHGQPQMMSARDRDAAGRAQALVEGGSAEGAPDAQQHVLLGYKLYQKGKNAEALQEYERAISLDSQSADAYFYHGLAAHRGGDEARALADLRSSIQLDPRRLDSYRLLDAILARQGRWDEIIGYWNDFLGRDSTNAQAFLERGGTFMHKGDREHARQDLESACRLGSSEGCQILARFGNTPNP
jgi:hypothetical protein